MLAANGYPLTPALSDTLTWGRAPAEPRSVPNEQGARAARGAAAAAARAETAATLPASTFARLAGASAIGLSVLLPLLNLALVVAFPELYGDVLPATIATALTLPLELRHVAFGIRGVRPPAGAWTLAALVLVYVAATAIVGGPWLLNFASLAVSVLIVLRGPWSLLAFGAVVASPALIASAPEHAARFPFLPASYLAFAVAWRSVTIYVPVRLVAAIRQLEAARQELRERAVLRQRVRIDAELREGLGPALEEIVARGRRALDALPGSATEAAAELRLLVAQSRHALADARRLVAGYRTGSARAELEAARALLEAAGVRSRVVVTDERALDAADERSRSAVRTALEQALRDSHVTGYRIEVGRDGRGELRVAMSPDDGSAEEAAVRP